MKCASTCLWAWQTHWEGHDSCARHLHKALHAERCQVPSAEHLKDALARQAGQRMVPTPGRHCSLKLLCLLGGTTYLLMREGQLFAAIV